MAGRTTLRSLIQGIAGAIASAQQEVERQQILNLGGYFDKMLRPLLMSIRVPSLRHDAEPGEEEILDIPILTLVPHNPLRISEVQVEFDIELGGVEDDGALDMPPAVNAMGRDDTSPEPKVRRILTDAFNGASSAKGPKAHVVIKVRDAEVPEGLARLLTELNKMHGSHPVSPDGATPAPAPAAGKAS
ncbi:MAG: DUF2589 domain-containing protein [Pseudomonadota bacterium]|nr:DUF2589 domain-containing protein [Pseudomonadota bacterium]